MPFVEVPLAASRCVRNARPRAKSFSEGYYEDVAGHHGHPFHGRAWHGRKCADAGAGRSRRRDVLAIAENSAAPTFTNTIEALEKAGQRLGRVESVFAVMTDNMSTPEY